MTDPTDTSTLLDVIDLAKYFPVRGGVRRRVVGYLKAVDGVSFSVSQGQTLGVVGESGCGKTTMGRLIMRMLDPDRGQIRFRSTVLGGGENPELVDLAQLSGHALKQVRTEIQMIFQDPFSSLNPRMSVKDILAEPFNIHRMGSRREIEERIAYLLRVVGLRPEYQNRLPHEFSGGQRQRIGIARALALSPRLIIADEPVSALDVSVRGQVLNLLTILQERFGLTYIFISHDLAVVEHIADRVAVMYLGRIVELGDVHSLYARPLHPYTEALLSAIPSPDPDAKRRRIILQGTIPSPRNPPAGCPFHTRCRYVRDLCQQETPPLRELRSGRWAACHFSEELPLEGINTATAGEKEIAVAMAATSQDARDVSERVRGQPAISQPDLDRG